MFIIYYYFLFPALKPLLFLHYIDNFGVKMFFLGPDSITSIPANVQFDGLGILKVFVAKSEDNSS